jgi:hypothetical protein
MGREHEKMQKNSKDGKYDKENTRRKVGIMMGDKKK